MKNINYLQSTNERSLKTGNGKRHIISMTIRIVVPIVFFAISFNQIKANAQVPGPSVRTDETNKHLDATQKTEDVSVGNGLCLLLLFGTVYTVIGLFSIHAVQLITETGQLLALKQEQEILEP